MDPLPYIDEHRRRIGGTPDAVWAALLVVLRQVFGRAAPIAWMLGCEPVRGTPALTGRLGDAVPGFRITDAEPGRRLVLRGRHRFADYALTFVSEDGQLRAETRAAFPGVAGRLYRAVVIGTGGHRRATERLLGQVARACKPRDFRRTA